jgi:hypothetical protein
MGMQQIHDLVLSTLVVAAFNGIRPARMHMGRFWNDSVFRGLVARAAARGWAWVTRSGCSSRGCWPISAIW